METGEPLLASDKETPLKSFCFVSFVLFMIIVFEKTSDCSLLSMYLSIRLPSFTWMKWQWRNRNKQNDFWLICNTKVEIPLKNRISVCRTSEILYVHLYEVWWALRTIPFNSRWMVNGTIFPFCSACTRSIVKSV